MSESIEKLLERMQKESVTLGWGAVVAYSRARLNRLLEQQYLTRLKENNYLPSFSAMLTGQESGASVSLQGVEFGTPLLSFSNASVSGSTALLTLNITKGTVTRSSGEVSSVELTEALGYWLEMQVDLETVQGEVDPYGRVALNIANGAKLRSNLLTGDQADATLNEQLMKALQAWIVSMPVRCAMFELGTVDFSGYDPLTPTRFILRTQAAPGARVRDANNYGDGAVLVFMRLRESESDGQAPDSSYLYLLPEGDYSATVVLSKDLLDHASEGGMELLARLLFPEHNAFVKKADHTPLDRAIFGNIDPMRTHYTVEPALGVVVVAGEKQQFKLRDGAGKELKATFWTATNVQGQTELSHGAIDTDGLYTAPVADQLGNEVQTVIIMAGYREAGELYYAAARLQVISDAVMPMPAFAAYRPDLTASGIDLWNAGRDRVQWQLLGRPQGELAGVGEKARFVPHRQTQRRVLSVQEVQARAGESRNAALVLVHHQPLVALDPPLVPKLAHGASTQLKDVNRIMPNEPRRWRMLAGPGHVSQSGGFTASTQRTPQPNVVACEVVRNGVIFAAGYSVVKETVVQADAHWKTLQLFTITVGKSNEGVSGIVGSSGFQQLEIEVTVETQQNDGKDYKLSPEEIASLALFDRAGQKIAGVCDNEDGIGTKYGNVWRTSLVKNRFVLANEGRLMPGEQTSLGVEDRTIRQTFYLHRRGTSGSQVFYAGFQAATGEWFYSNATSHKNATIEVKVRTPEPYKASDYTLVRKRVGGGGGDLGGADPEHEDFDLHPVTDDYWLLDYRQGTFYTAEFVKARESDNIRNVNTSMVRWESPYGSELFHSYTGYLFQNHGQPEPESVSFDSSMGEVLARTDFSKPVASEYEAGLLVIANFRNKNHLLSDARKTSGFSKMSKPLRVQLRDSQGNVHLVQVDYLPADTIGDRNVLVHSVPSRPIMGEGSTIRLNFAEESHHENH